MDAYTLSMLFLLLIICVGLVLLVCVLFLHYQHRKYAHIPSPPRQSFISGHLQMLESYKKKNMAYADAYVDIMRKYGPVFHVFFYSNPIVVVLDPEFVKEMLCTRTHRKPYSYTKPFTQLFGIRFLGRGLAAEVNPEIHEPRRSLLNPAFHRKYLMSLMHEFNASADLMIEKLYPKADGKTEVAMLDEFDKITLDVIAKVAFGKDLNIILDNESPFNKAISVCFNGVSATVSNPMLEFSPFPAARKYKKEVRDNIKFLREMGRQCIEQRLGEMERQEDVPKDILTYILKAVAELKGDDGFQIEDIIDDFLTFFVAGQETSANLLSFTLLELGHHPEIMHRLKTEVKSVFGDKENLEYTDVVKLDYMMEVLKEALRLWPPVTGTYREMAHDVTVKGYKIPKGTVVMVNTFVMARMEEYFHDPLQFDPNRFKTSDDKPQYAYFPFSLGSRNCIGQQFAMIESRVLLAKLIQRFDFELVPGQGHDVLDEFTLKPMGRCKNYIRPVE